MEQGTQDDLPLNQAPDAATDAVLKPSAPVAAGARVVRGIEFNEYDDKTLTVDELVNNMANMGFQASAVSEAVRIVNDMVSCTAHTCSRVLLLN